MRNAMIAAALASGFLAAPWLLLGGDLPRAGDGATDALVVREGVLPRSGVGRVTALRVADPERLATLEAFFPDYRKRPSSDLSGGWKAGYRVYFSFPGGETIRITVSENDGGGRWTAGRGDFATNGDFKRFFEELSR